MKKLKYIYAFFVAVLLGFAVSSCEDDDVVAAEVTEETTEGSGETVKTTFTVGISAPDVSADIDPVTRASADNANIEYAKPENGGRFQNIVVVLVGPQITTDRTNLGNHKIYGIHCHNWNDGVGVKEYNVIFSDVNIDKANDLGKDFTVYAFGNVSKEDYDEIEKEQNAKIFEKWTDFKEGCIEPVLSFKSADIYGINFVPSAEYYRGNSDINVRGTTAKKVTSTGMPVNNSATAIAVKGNTQFNVALKRVCARLQVTFRNFTGKTGYSGEPETGNNVYVDKFEIPNILATSTNYAAWKSAPSTSNTPFRLSELVDKFKDAGDTSFDKDHVKVENGDQITVSMYVFETKKASGNYTYDLKVDRGKSLGKNTTTIQPGNSYVIWNNQAHQSLAIKNNVICTVEQNSMVDIPFNEQVFWQIESAPDSKLADTYVLNHCLYNSSTDKATPENKYLQQQPDPTDWGMHFYCSKCRKTVDILHYLNLTHISSISYTLVDSEFSHIFTSSAATSDGNAQYVNFVLKGGLADSEESRYTFNLLNKSDKKKNQNYWETVGSNYRYLFLTVKDDNNLGCVRGMAYNTSQTLGEYDWTLYAKYIIKNEAVNFNKGEKGTISQIERNHSYELDFSVMPNYDTKQEILVNCVRKQNEINWSEVEK